MACKIQSTELAALLKTAASIVETKNMLPILACVKLEARDNILFITTTNLDVEFKASLPCNVKTPFQCAVDAKRLAVMASAASGDMTLALDGSILSVKAKSRWKVPAIPVDDFPLMPVSDLCKPMAFNPGPLVKRLLWAASTEMSRAYLSGIYMNEDGGKAHYIASNGYVMPMVASADKWPKSSPNVILAPGFLKALPDDTGKLEWDDRKVRFTSGDITVTGKVIEGRFPDWRNIIPAPCEPYAVDAEALAGAVRRVRLASDAKERKLRITRGDGLLAVRIEGTSGFEGSEDVEADCSAGFEMGVNADYLVGMLAALDSEAITVEQSAPGSTMVIRPTVQPTGESVTGLVWPLRI